MLSAASSSWLSVLSIVLLVYPDHKSCTCGVTLGNTVLLPITALTLFGTTSVGFVRQDELVLFSFPYACRTTIADMDYRCIDCCVFCASLCIKVQPSIAIHDYIRQLHTIAAGGGPVESGILWIKRRTSSVLETVWQGRCLLMAHIARPVQGCSGWKIFSCIWRWSTSYCLCPWKYRLQGSVSPSSSVSAAVCPWISCGGIWLSRIWGFRWITLRSRTARRPWTGLELAAASSRRCTSFCVWTLFRNCTCFKVGCSFGKLKWVNDPYV